MKKSLFIAAMLISIASFSQKVYSTKSGQISFNASSPIEKIKGINNQADSKMIDKNGQIVFMLLIKSFKFENQLMEDHFNENYMESTKFPKADFKGFITNINSVDFTKDGKYPVTADGTLTLHGVSKKVQPTGVITINDGKVTLTSTFRIALKDYNVTGSYIGSKIASDVEINVQCKYE
ncbi:MAG TPA: YceI family protein [Chitinophagaceae bacterium]|nr:YceI family protein [Chitinophagaceae bacterium]HCT24551.1 YceI family protein [Chitinophagaceae bacterium]